MDYPAIIPYAKSKQLMGRELTPDERSVRGVVVNGLTEAEIQVLHDFEGMVIAFDSLIIVSRA